MTGAKWMQGEDSDLGGTVDEDLGLDAASKRIKDTWQDADDLLDFLDDAFDMERATKEDRGERRGKVDAEQGASSWKRGSQEAVREVKTLRWMERATAALTMRPESETNGRIFELQRQPYCAR
jgi:hypothetical protein